MMAQMLDGDNATKRKRADGGPLLDISGMEGFALLNEHERKLCSELALIPQHYMVIKERLIRYSQSAPSLHLTQLWHAPCPWLTSVYPLVCCWWF
jgi:hypothetical protein